MGVHSRFRIMFFFFVVVVVTIRTAVGPRWWWRWGITGPSGWFAIVVVIIIILIDIMATFILFMLLHNEEYIIRSQLYIMYMGWVIAKYYQGTACSGVGFAFCSSSGGLTEAVV